MPKDAKHLSVRLDGPTLARLDAIVRILSERGPEPTTSQVVRHAIDQLYTRLRDDGRDDAERSGARDEGRHA
jgi:hypothetical protein